ncbi:surfactin synthase thioesterase subunit [Catenulispora sp. GAS73]|uniref:thioesterase II family protein n=1 Tax=Catenulispora sp. GAS73 TaxID=3156269 RepID=UPI0035148553
MPDSRWFRTFHPGPEAGPRLVCLPHAGGAASAFFPLSTALAGRVEVLAVQYPGRQERRAEPAIESIPGLAEHLAGLLEPLTGRPLGLLGHSMGASVAFELASLLGDRVAALFVSARRPPSRALPETVHMLDDHGILANIRELSGTDARLFANEDLVRLAMPALRADYRALGAYRPDRQARLDVPISVLVGDDDPLTPVDSARGWAAHTDGPCDTHVFPGGHFYINGWTTHVAEIVARTLQTVAVTA